MKKKETRVLAFDLGASSGRAILGIYDGVTLRYEEIHRFENKPLVSDRLRWDYSTLLAEIHKGIQKAGSLNSLAFDTWGVDFGLLDENGRLIADPDQYFNTRSEKLIEEVTEKISLEDLYERTGNQIMLINTLFQLIDMRQNQPELMKKAKKLLFMPELFTYSLCGKTCSEQTIASTSQMLNPITKQWDFELMKMLGISPELFAPTVKSGTVVGEFEHNGKAVKVIAVAGHDTQCAVAALPTEKEDIAFLSCGTWSLIGTELSHPILTKESLDSALSNEVGANGKINYLKNIIGLRLLQECRRNWNEQGRSFDFSELASLAEKAKPFTCFIDPDSPEFNSTNDMAGSIKEYCRRTNQPIPQTVGEICRCIYESLALKYRYAINQLRSLTNKSFSALHIVGGGSAASLLCSMTASACNIPIIAGPTEATALGNIIIQLVALKKIESIDMGRKLIAASEPLRRYEPEPNGEWDSAYKKFCKLINLK